VPISLPVDDEANELLSRNALALLIAMLLDQQVPLERAFSAPRDLVRRLGHEPTADELAEFDPEALAAVFSERPALHRFPKAMAARTQELARLIVTEYDGDAAALWATAPSGDELLKRVSALPGFGEAKAKIFVALLGKQLGVRPPGWQMAAGSFGEDGSYVSVADITDDESLGKVRIHKQAMKAAAKSKAAK
jgi:uncharacterized HhH-GPD family protein